MAKENEPKRNKTKPIKRVSVVDQVCDSIKEDIANNFYEEGEKLPSEEELAGQFGVNRLSVRMALQKLNTLGLVETRVGDGTYVKAFSFTPFLSELAVFYERESCYKDVIQLRDLLEMECLRQAVEHSTEEEKQRLKAALEYYNDMAEVLQENMEDEQRWDYLVDADFMFHLQTVHMSHNALYNDIYLMVQGLIREHIKSLLKQRILARRAAGLPPKLTSDTHDEIYHAIVDGDTAVIKRLVQEMLGIIPIEGLDVFDKTETEP